MSSNQNLTSSQIPTITDDQIFSNETIWQLVTKRGKIWKSVVEYFGKLREMAPHIKVREETIEILMHKRSMYNLKEKDWLDSDKLTRGRVIRGVRLALDESTPVKFLDANRKRGQSAITSRIYIMEHLELAVRGNYR